MDTGFILNVITLVGLGLFGFFAVIGQFNKANKQVKDDSDAAETRIINLLKEQVSALEKKVEDQAHLLEETAKKLDILANENRTLKDVLQGRDKATMDYQAAGRKAMAQGDEIYKMVQEIKTTVDKIAANAQMTVNVTK